MRTMSFFEEVGSLVDRRWKERNYNEAQFPEVAARCLAELPPHEHVSLWSVVQWALTAPTLPYQVDLDAAFGDPPVTVYIGRKFRIEVLFWTQGTPGIHQHSFSGAFHVMHGSSIHSLWGFKPTERIELRLILGQVTFCGAEILVKGDTRLILPGDQMFHATFHLDRPSVTVVVRTASEADHGPQYALLPPSIAFAPLDEIPSVKRQSQLLNMLLLSGRHAEYAEMALHASCAQDAYSVFNFLHGSFAMIQDPDLRDRLIHTTKMKHPNLMIALEPALAHVERKIKTLAIRNGVERADIRFLLALLCNIPERTRILEFIKGRFPSKDPVAFIACCLQKLSGTAVSEAYFHESWLVLLQSYLRDEMPEDRERAYFEYCQRNALEVDKAAMREISLRLRSSWLLKPLFEPGADRPN